jgi:hypothetical protein
MSPSPQAVRDARVIFSRGQEDFTARDVIDAAYVRGELVPLWNEFNRACECEQRASDEDLELDDSAIDSAAIAFRYEHDLITAEETERWLEDRAISMEQFGEHFVRQYWARNYAGEIVLSDRDYISATPEEKDSFVAHLTLGGELDRMAEQLSFRLAAQAAQALSQGVASEREKFVAREKISDLPRWLAQIARNGDWLDGILAGEIAFRHQMASALDERALERELVSMRLNLTRFELETIEVDSRDAAAEVLACVRSDGMELSEIAEESRYPFRHSEILLEDLPAEQQGSFLSARAGVLLDPIVREDGYELCRVKTRVDPQLSDHRIRERLQERISRRHFSELVSKYIDWKLLQPAAS